jgi:hypothetical protein
MNLYEPTDNRNMKLELLLEGGQQLITLEEIYA